MSDRPFSKTFSSRHSVPCVVPAHNFRQVIDHLCGGAANAIAEELDLCDSRSTGINASYCCVRTSSRVFADDEPLPRGEERGARAE